MKYVVLNCFKAQTNKGEKELQAGQIISLPPTIALSLIQQGKIALSPELQEALEERSVIMEHDGSLEQEEAERLAWCRVVCMLSFPSQWRECERFNPKPCPKLQINFQAR